MHKALWEKIVVVHNENKSLFIWCEENCNGLKSFLQPNNELKNAWEHVVRAKANELGIGSDPNEQYITASLEKVLSHEYRAFFDICDWLSIHLRDRISNILEPYNNGTISAVIPKYYTEIKPKCERVCTEIAILRATKDISIGGDILKHVAKYGGIAEFVGERSEHFTFVARLFAGAWASPLRVATGGNARWRLAARCRRSPAPANETARLRFGVALGGRVALRAGGG